MYRTQGMMYEAKTSQHYDPINHAVGVYMDAINIFVRILMIMNSRKK